MKISSKIHNTLKKFFYKEPLNGIAAENSIKEALLSGDPIMVARFGSTEIKAIIYAKLPFFLKRLYGFKIKRELNNFSGFFPTTDENIEKFANLMREDMQLVDILGSWRIEEIFFKKYLKKATRVKLNSLEPYLQTNPWSELLEGKNVLIIHPFVESIAKQYNNRREILFSDKRILPIFNSLQTIKSVQSLAGNSTRFDNWFEALNFMKLEIDKLDFDVAIVGCGAYGFPLAAHIKRRSKVAIHLGGATQILFGVKGKRWVEDEKFKFIINEHFVSPSKKEIIGDAVKVEGGSYW